MKKIIPFLLVLFIASSALNAQTFLSFKNSKEMFYTVIDTASHFVALIPSQMGCYGGKVIVPDSVTYRGESYAVTTIKGVTSDGRTGAFTRCTHLTAVTLPATLTTIEASAFQGCESLTTLTIPPSVTTIGESAFANCSALTEVIIQNPNLQFPDSAFPKEAKITYPQQ